MGNKIALFDTSISSKNLGDEIIMEHVWKELNRLFPEQRFFRVPTHEGLGPSSYDCLKLSEYSFVGGTNLLSSNMPFYKQWKVNYRDSFRINNAILFGVGWWQYQDRPNIYTKYLLRRLLSDNILHSVRDSYTKSQLESIGINNVINTACPTMWGLTPRHCEKISRQKADSVVITLTSYNKAPDLDKEFINIIESNYTDIYFWPQGGDDIKYFKSISKGKDIKILNDTIESYKKVLQRNSVDYIGTRLHAGIFALNNEARTIILSIDNRAKEMSNDFNINTHPRKNISGLQEIIQSKFKTQVSIPLDNINRWKRQFQ